MPRRLTVFLEAPPADGLRYAQDHFKEYVKPILVASGIDWDFVQGRKEGDVRAELAEKLRKQRLGFDPNNEDEDPVMKVRMSNGTKDFDGPQGDIIIGRNTWKEYVRGLHEGWLGPTVAPALPAPSTQEAIPQTTVQPDSGITLLSEPREATPDEKSGTEATPEEDNKPKKPPQPAPFISTSEYSSAPIPSTIPSEFAPSNPVPIPHVLGFLKTPQRLWRFLNRRQLADNIGRDVAAVILHTYGRPYSATSSGVERSAFAVDYQSDSASNSDEVDETSNRGQSQTSEQALALIAEEKDWHKSIKKPIAEATTQPERTWLDPVITDPRIASRMRRAELSADEEARAHSFVIPEEEIEGWIKGQFRTLFRYTAAVIKGTGKDNGPNIGDPEVDSVTGEGPVTSNQGFVPGVVAGMRMPSPTQPVGAGAGRMSKFQ